MPFNITPKNRWNGWKFLALIGGIISFTYPIIVYPLSHIEEYKAIQKETRRGINQEQIQPGNMKVWSDPFDRK